MLETRTLDLPLLLPAARECDRCTDRPRDALRQVPGIRSADLTSDGDSLLLTYDPGQLTLESIECHAARIGIDPGTRIRHTTLRIAGMDCPDCALKIEKSVQRLPGVLTAQANYASARMWIEFEPESVDLNDVIDRIANLGYGIEDDSKADASSMSFRRYRTFLATAVSGFFLLLDTILRGIGASGSASTALYALGLASGGYPLARAAVGAFRTLTFDTDFPMLVAGRLGVDKVRAGLLPDRKVDAVKEYVDRYDSVAMVGDGVNDAPALALATVGIAMGAAGSDTALETADVALMGDDLAGVAFAIRLSRRLRRIVRQNTAFSFAVIVSLVAGIFVKHIGLATGVLGHEGSALLVVLNGMRLLKERTAA